MNQRIVFEIWSRDGTKVADLTGLATGRQIKVGRNEPEEINFNVDADALKTYADSIFTTPEELLAAGSREVRVRYFDPETGVDEYLCGARIDYVDTVVSQTDRDISVRAYGFLNMLADRILEVQREFTAIDLSTICWTLIDESQGGNANAYQAPLPDAEVCDFGITQGTLTTIAPRDRTLKVGTNLKDFLVRSTELSTVAMDFSFSADKVFSTHSRLGSSIPNTIFRYPGNIIDGNIPTDAKGISNRVITLGSGIGDEATSQSIDEDSASQINYRLRQKSLLFSSINDEDELSDHGAARIATTKDPLRLPNLSVDLNKDIRINDIWAGDSPRFIIKDPALPVAVDGQYRIERMDVRIDEEEKVYAKLTVA